MNSAPYISVTEFKTFNPELDFTNYVDTTISGMITRASAYVDNFLQYSLSVEDISNEVNESLVDSDGNLMIYTKKVPIQSVSGITLKMGTYSTDLSLTSGSDNRYDITAEGRYVLYPYQEVTLTGTVVIRDFFSIRSRKLLTKVSYRAGYETIPNDIKDAVNLLTKDIFIRQANPMDLSSVSQGGISMSYRDRTDGRSDMALDAERILESYKLRFPA